MRAYFKKYIKIESYFDKRFNKIAPALSIKLFVEVKLKKNLIEKIEACKTSLINIREERSAR